jgi:hypothetical protein
MQRTKRLRVYVLCMGATSAIGIAAAVGLVAQHRQSTSVSASEADAEIALIRSRFSPQGPLVDMTVRRPSDASTMLTARHQLRTFHTVIFDTRGGDRIVRITVPYWLARRYARHDGEFHWLGELTFLDDTEFDPESISVSLDQLERRGPGLVVDYRHPSGGQFVSWVD